MSEPFSLSVACEYRSAPPGASKTWAALRIEPKGKPLEDERAPLAIVLAVDVSGSMAGDPLTHVMRSCEVLADLLTEKDELGIVTFSSNAAVLIGLTRMDAKGRASLRASLLTMHAHGSTNIHGGLGVAAGLLVSASTELRRVVVLMSDGQPNVGLSSASDLAGYVTGLKLAVSTLGFGVHHDENVLAAIARAGSGRYAYIPDPISSRVDLARAALAHGGIVADRLELTLKTREGVSITQVLPEVAMRIGGGGVSFGVGDVFVDEGRTLAVELALDLEGPHDGRLLEATLTGFSPDGTKHRVTATVSVDVRSGDRTGDRDAQRDVVFVLADDARNVARAQADRGAIPAAVTLLRALVSRIDGLEGFVANDGSPLAELREQLVDEAANYEKSEDVEERSHRRKAAVSYQASVPSMPAAARVPAPVPAFLVGLGGVAGNQRFQLFTENKIGRSSMCELYVQSGSLSRVHARILFFNGEFRLEDMGSTNGTRLNAVVVRSAKLNDGDRVDFGGAAYRFETG